MEVQYDKNIIYIDEGNLGTLNDDVLRAGDLSQIRARISAIEKQMRILKHRNWRKYGRTR